MADYQRTSYCFRTDDFMNDTFNVTEFVTECRQRVPLSVLSKDLLYLCWVQCFKPSCLEWTDRHFLHWRNFDGLGDYFSSLKTAVVSLINEDYADFVDLSSNLVGLDKAISQIQGPLEQISEQVTAVQTVMNTQMKILETNLAERAETRNKKATLQRFLNIASSVEKIETLLKLNDYEGPPDLTVSLSSSSGDEDGEVGKLIERVAAEFNQLQFYITQCEGLPFVKSIQPRIDKITDTLQQGLERSFQQGIATDDWDVLSQCLRTYAMIDKASDAEELFRRMVVAPFLQEVATKELVQSHGEGLEDMFNKVLVFVNEKCSTLVETSASLGRFDFIVNSVWNELVDAIIGRLSFVFTPGIAPTFHRNYSVTQRFLVKFEMECKTLESVRRLREHPQYAAFLKRWSLPVYFQLRFQEIAGAVELALTEAPHESTKAQENPLLRDLWLHQAQVVGESLMLCWAENIFIPALSHRFWKMSLQVIARFSTWLKDLELSEEVTVDTIAQTVHSSKQFLDIAPKIFAETIAPRLSDCIPDFNESKYLDALTSGTLLCLEATKASRERVADFFVSRVEPRLKQAELVPTQYRALKKPPPTAASSYAENVFGDLAEFLRKNQSVIDTPKEWVLTPVTAAIDRFKAISDDKISASIKLENSVMRMKKKKRKGKAAVAEQQGMSDSDKIRMQYLLDAEAIGKQVEEFGINLESDIPAFGPLIAKLNTPTEISDLMAEERSGANSPTEEKVMDMPGEADSAEAPADGVGDVREL